MRRSQMRGGEAVCFLLLLLRRRCNRIRFRLRSAAAVFALPRAVKMGMRLYIVPAEAGKGSGLPLERAEFFALRRAGKFGAAWGCRNFLTPPQTAAKLLSGAGAHDKNKPIAARA